MAQGGAPGLPPRGGSRPALEQGEVLSLLPHGRARVKIPKSSDCSSCEHKRFCDPFGSEHMVLEAANDLGARAGQRVEVELTLERRTKAIFILYVLPLIFLVLGAVLGNALDPLGNKDLSATLFSLGFVVLSFAGIHRYSKRKAASDASGGPRITKVLNAPEA